MKSLLVFCWFLLAVSAIRYKEKKTTLEDVEKEYQAGQKRIKQSPPPAKVPPGQSPTQYGFVPVKTFADYVQQEPRPNYYPTTYSPQSSQQYTQVYTPQTNYAQYATTQQFTNNLSQKYASAGQDVSSQDSAPAQKYTVAKYNSQPESSSYAQGPTDYQQYENVQYITDNSIATPSGQQYYSTPQYVYLQQYQAPSTSIQTVVDPKGTGLQYVMYVPTLIPTAEQTQNYENVVYSTGAESSSNYQVPQSQYQQQEQTQYQPQEQTQTQYIQPESKIAPTDFVVKREPKSLLDSYIPSILQLQYYRQAQQNSIQDTIKIPRAFNGQKNFKPATAESSVRYAYRPSTHKS